MSERISKTQRWLDLIALLLNRRMALTVDEIMRRVPAYAESWDREDETARGSVRRMFERDKDELREMGIPIESVRYEQGGETLEGYRIQRRDFYLPYLKVLGSEAARGRPGYALPSTELQPQEAELALDALRRIADLSAFPFADEARSAYSKLAFDLVADGTPGTWAIQLERPGTAEVLERLRSLAEAVLAAKRVRFRYHGIHRGTPTDREVEPYGLFLQRDWYLVGRDLDRDALRLYRVSRMEEVAMNTKRLKERDFGVPADFDLRSFVDRRAWELTDDEPVRAEVRFRFPSSLLVDRSGEGELVSRALDGSTVRAFGVSDPNPFLRWVLGFAGEATVVSPPDLRNDFHRMAAEVAALYGSRDG